MNQENYRKLISGQESGVVAQLFRFLLGVATIFYSLAIGLRNFLYSRRWLKIHRVDAAVISIGNITTGGTGKTPLVIRLYNYINQKTKNKNQNCGCAILTRGYKATQNSKLKTQNYKDEIAILAEGCPQAKVIVNPDRVAGAAEAVNKFGAKVLIMDDGFQHRRLCRNLDIVTIDATLPFGYGRMLPAGLLREPVTSLRRADAVVMTRCDQVSESELSQIENTLQAINPGMIIARSIHVPVCAKSMDNQEIGPGELKGKRIFAFCGIGNPEAFISTIKGLGANLVGSKIYNDHYHYTDKDIADIYEQAAHLKADLILTTQKDWSRFPIENRNLSDPLPSHSCLRQEDVGGDAGACDSQESKIENPFAYLAIELKFIRSEDKITQLIEQTLAGKIHKKY